MFKDLFPDLKREAEDEIVRRNLLQSQQTVVPVNIYTYSSGDLSLKINQSIMIDLIQCYSQWIYKGRPETL